MPLHILAFVSVNCAIYIEYHNTDTASCMSHSNAPTVDITESVYKLNSCNDNHAVVVPRKLRKVVQFVPNLFYNPMFFITSLYYFSIRT